MIDPPSKAYLVETRVNGDISRMKTMIRNLSDESFLRSQCASARSRLQVIENFLGRPNEARGSFLLGAKAGHADACLFGWYAFSRLNQDLVRGVWDHESLPNVREWVGRMLESGLVKREELY